MFEDALDGLSPSPSLITSYNKLFDSRDIIARIDHLSKLEASGPVDLGEQDNNTDQDTLFTELKMLREFAQEYELMTEWEDRVTFVRDDYFKNYAVAQAKDMHGDLRQWPFNCIDWVEAVEELQRDYFSTEFDGSTYWVRY